MGPIPQNSLQLAWYNAGTKRWDILDGIHKVKEKELAVVVKELGGIYAILGGYNFGINNKDNIITQGRNIKEDVAE